MTEENTPLQLYNVPTNKPCPKCEMKLWERNKHRWPYPVEEYCPRKHYRKEIPDFTVGIPLSDSLTKTGDDK